MNKLYSFFGGRKLFVFFFMYITQYIMAMYGKWSDGFGYASVGLYGVIVVGIEYNKRGKKDGDIGE